jgi:hypothetical protein
VFQYGGEDPANKVRRTLDGFFFLSAAVSCWCGETDQLFRVGVRFFCALHKPREG